MDIFETKWYRSTITGTYFYEFEVKYIEDAIFGKGRLDDLIDDGVLEAINPPSVIDLLKQNRISVATRRYKEIHNVTLLEATKMVKLIQEDMKKYESRD